MIAVGILYTLCNQLLGYCVNYTAIDTYNAMLHDKFINDQFIQAFIEYLTDTYNYDALAIMYTR